MIVLTAIAASERRYDSDTKQQDNTGDWTDPLEHNSSDEAVGTLHAQPRQTAIGETDKYDAIKNGQAAQGIPLTTVCFW
jgi:hypothetical protein